MHPFTIWVGTKPGLWTLDSGLDYGLDYGLNYGLNYGLDFGLSWTINRVLDLLFKEDIECWIAQ